MPPYILSIIPLVHATVRFQNDWRYCLHGVQRHEEFGNGTALATDGVVAVFLPQATDLPVLVQKANLAGKIESFVENRKPKAAKKDSSEAGKHKPASRKSRISFEVLAILAEL